MFGYNINFIFINIFNLYYLVWVDNDKNNVDFLIWFFLILSLIVKKKKEFIV